MPADDLALLVGAAREAGALPRRPISARRPPAREKPGGAGARHRRPISRSTPSCAGPSPPPGPATAGFRRETRTARPASSPSVVFIVDPIDGTRAFVAGEPGWALFPGRRRARRGDRRGGLSCPCWSGSTPPPPAVAPPANGAPVRREPAAGARGATLLAARPALAAENWRAGAPPPMERVFRPSLAHRMSLVADGRFDAMLTLRPTWEWDVRRRRAPRRRGRRAGERPCRRAAALQRGHPARARGARRGPRRARRARRRPRPVSRARSLRPGGADKPTRPSRQRSPEALGWSAGVPEA